MSKYKWISKEVVLAIHAEQINEHGGQEGARDLSLLESALSKPKNKLAYNPKATPEALAASYCFGIINNHPFIDGNKRTGFVVMNLFLELNKLYITADKRSKYITIMEVASGIMTEKELSIWLKRNIAKLL